MGMEGYPNYTREWRRSYKIKESLSKTGKNKVLEYCQDIRGNSWKVSDLDGFLAAFSPLPPEALCLGLASDGLPLFVNLKEPSNGPILVVGESVVGKTEFLGSIGLGVSAFHKPTVMQYGVITSDPAAWRGFGQFPHCVDVFSVQSLKTIEFLHSLYLWASEEKKLNQSVLVLMDGPELLFHRQPVVHQIVEWFLNYGPEFRVWPVFSVDVNQLTQIENWLEVFKIRISGQISATHDWYPEGDNKKSSHIIETGDESWLTDRNGWLRLHAITSDL
jgi:hypothetical protein